MSLEQDAISQAAQILEQNRSIPVEVPLSTAYWIGTTLVRAQFGSHENEKLALNQSIVAKLGKVVPAELIAGGADNFSGDLYKQVTVPLSQRDLEHISQAVLSLPTGKQVADSFGSDPNTRLVMQGFVNRQLNSFLSLAQAFSLAGGNLDPKVKHAVEELLH